jgi:hypothetical protein
LFIDGRPVPLGWSLEGLAVGEIEAIEAYGIGSPMDKRLKQLIVDTELISGQPRCGRFAQRSGDGDEDAPNWVAPPVRNINPQLFIGSVVIWLRR